MTDQQLLQLLPDYRAGRLDPAVCKEIEQRLAASDSLRQSYEETKRYFDALDALEPQRAPDDFLDRVHAGIEKRQGIGAWLFRPFHIKIPLELAGVAVTVILLIFMFNPFSGRVSRDLLEPERAAYRDRKNKESVRQPKLDYSEAPEPARKPIPAERKIPATRAKRPAKSPPARARRSTPSAKPAIKKAPPRPLSSPDEQSNEAVQSGVKTQEGHYSRMESPVKKAEIPSDAVKEVETVRPSTEKKAAPSPTYKSASNKKDSRFCPAPPALDEADDAFADAEPSAPPAPKASGKEAAKSSYSHDADVAMEESYGVDEMAEELRSGKKLKRRRNRKQHPSASSPAPVMTKPVKAPLELIREVAYHQSVKVDSVLHADDYHCNVIVSVKEANVKRFTQMLSELVTVISFRKQSERMVDGRLRYVLQVSSK